MTKNKTLLRFFLNTGVIITLVFASNEFKTLYQKPTIKIDPEFESIFHKTVVSDKLSQNDQFVFQKASKNKSKIDKQRYQKSYQKLH